MSNLESIIDGGNVYAKNGQKVDLATYCVGKTVGFYFSGQWCTPCKTFTSILVDFYRKHSQKKNFEIIFVSSDRDERAFTEYYSQMPWLCLSFKERGLRKNLADKYNVGSIPTLVLINADSGEVYTTEARTKLQFKDKNGNKFPWKDRSKKDKKCNIM